MPTLFQYPRWVTEGTQTGYITSPNPVWYNASSSATSITTYATDATGLYSASYLGNSYAWVDEAQAYTPERQQAIAAGAQQNAVEAHAAFIAQIEADRNRAVVEATIQAEADRKAEEVLVAFLSPEQRAMYSSRRCFDVVTQLGRYRLHYGWAGNIAQIDSRDRELRRFCIHPREGQEFKIPHAENLLSQKLMLEFEEQEFLRVANVHAARAA